MTKQTFNIKEIQPNKGERTIDKKATVIQLREALEPYVRLVFGRSTPEELLRDLSELCEGLNYIKTRQEHVSLFSDNPKILDLLFIFPSGRIRTIKSLMSLFSSENGVAWGEIERAYGHNAKLITKQ